MTPLETLIHNFSIQNLHAFFRNKISSFKQDDDDFDHLFNDDTFDKYESITKIGEATIENDEIVFIASRTNDPLTERSGKKKQYEIAKSILKHENVDAALFVFYDENGNFRFSFVKANYLGTKRDYTDFKRYSYFVSPKQTNKTFIKQVGNCNFTTLDEIIKSFSVEPLNKDFYQEIAKAFYGLIGGKIKINTKEVTHERILKLPSVDESNGKVFQEFAVRLIGRTIFCWFLKNKKSDAGKALIPEQWLASNTVIETNNNQHNYYHAYLEKLFFLILNKKVADRKPYTLPNGHEDVPFLNGGLFEAQHDDYFPKNNKGIHQILPNLVIPNDWFENLFKVLEQYNFTIDENSINDSEVSIDPEMLGTIFENLLAEIDPDTEKSARKSTGSFYTPREIVDYMVEQSLLNYLKNKTGIADEEQLQSLFKEGTENPFDDKPTKAILQALSDVKILDPACGSGAFPMGALHKIIVILKKLDKGAEWWKQKQLEKIDNAVVRKALKEKLDHSTSDYARKLGVIQHSIYGVDIQPIASEISKLRSFLSLIIDENIDDTVENRGVEPLPNLEFKFVTANTLIGLDEGSSHKTLAFDFGETDNLQNKLQEIRSDYLQTSGEEKENLKKEFEKVQQEIFKNELKGGAVNKRAQQLVSWKPFKNDASDWFDPLWMFGVEKFDIVIGNPPYSVIFNKDLKKTYEKKYSVFKRNNDIYSAFYHQGIKIIRENGFINYITPNTFLNGDYFKELRRYISNNTQIIEIFDFKQSKVFQDPTVYVCIFLGQKQKPEIIQNYSTKLKIYLNNLLITDIKNINIEKNSDNNFKPINKIINKIFSNINVSILENHFFVKDVGFNYWSIGKGKKRDGNSIGDRILYHGEKQNKNDLPYLKGRDIEKYNLATTNNYLKHNYKTFLIDDVDVFRYSEEFLLQNEKIIYRQTSNKIIATIDSNKNLVDKTVHIITPKMDNPIISLKILCGFINSKLFDYLYKYLSQETEGRAFAQVKTTYVKQFPLIKINNKLEIELTKLVEKIFELKLSNKDTSLYEEKLDLIILKIYQINYDEVLLIDPEFKLTQTEYDNYKIE